MLNINVASNLRRNEGPVIEATIRRIVTYEVMRFQSLSFTIYGVLLCLHGASAMHVHVACILLLLVDSCYL